MSADELGQLRILTVSDAQIAFSGSFSENLALLDAAQADALQVCCFENDGHLIGMAVLKRPPVSPDWVPHDAVSLHALMIDRNWQGRGFGKMALALAAEEAARLWPAAKSLVLAVDTENAAALSLYRRFGMSDFGPPYTGRVGLEQRMTMPLQRKTQMQGGGEFTE